MEIRDYLRAIRHWLWMPVVLPLVAGGATGLLMLRQPLQYQATATVVVPAVSAKGFSTSAAAQYVATFKDVLVSQPLVQQVSAQTHVPTKDLVGGLIAETITASSNIIHVTYTGPVKNSVTGVVRAATVDALDIVAQPQLVQAQNAVNTSQTQLAKTNSAITQFTADTGIVYPDVDFKTKQNELAQLLLQLQQAGLAHDAARAAALQTVIAQRQADLTTEAAQVSRYTALTEQRQAALTVLSHNQQLLGDAQALLTANHDPKTVTVNELGKVSRVGNILKFSAIAAAVALILVLALILLLELMRGRRPAVVRDSTARDSAAAAKAPAAGPGSKFRIRRRPRGTPQNGTTPPVFYGDEPDAPAAEPPVAASGGTRTRR